MVTLCIGSAAWMISGVSGHRYYRHVTGIGNGTISHQLSRTVRVAPEVR